MTTKRYLGQIEWYERIIKNKLLEIERLDALLKTIPALPYDEDKVQSSGDQDKLGASVAKLLDVKAEIENLLDDYLTKRDTIINQIESLSDARYLKVMSLCYLEYKELWDVANEAGYTYQYVRQVHKKALREFERRYGQEYLKKQ